MKTKLLILLIFICSSLKGQIIGDHLNTIKTKEPGGEVKKTETGYTYSVQKRGSIDMYFFDINLICVANMFTASSSQQLQGYVEMFNKNWVIINSHKWMFYGSNDYTISCVLTHVDDVGEVFFIKKYEE